MPALFAYVLAVAIFLGGGYGALNWLAGAEPVKVAAKAKHAPRPETYGAVAAQPAPQPDAASPESTGDASGKAEASGPSAVSMTAAAAGPDKRYDAMARAAPTVADKAATPPAPAIKPVAAPALAKPEAGPEAARPLTKAASADREGRRMETPPKRPRIRQAEERGHRRYEVMTLRTIEFEDGHRETRLLPLRRQDALASRWGD